MLRGRIDIHKQPGMSSHDVVYRVRKALGIKRVGHSGTLDPMAEGVLSIYIGQATKFIDLLKSSYKTYDVCFEYGKSSETFDIMGEVSDVELPSITREAFETAAYRFIGRQEQLPPMYSAIKHKGRPLYRYAREGQVIERRARTIEITELTVMDWDGRHGRIILRCSSGTYVRSFVVDLAAQLGTGGVMTNLVRLENDFVPLSECISLEDVSAQAIRPPDAFHPGPRVEISYDDYLRLRQGQTHLIASEETADRILLTVGGRFAGTARRSPQGYMREKIYHDISSPE